MANLWSKILLMGGSILFLVLKLLGHMPYSYDRKSGFFKVNGFEYIYSIFTGIVFTVFFPSSIRRFYNSLEILPTTRTTVTVTLCFVILYYIILITAYFRIVRYRNEICRTLNQFKSLCKSFTEDFPQVRIPNIDRKLLLFLFEINLICSALGTVFAMNFDSLSSHKLPFYSIFVAIIPGVTSMTLNNMFFIGIYILNSILTKINSKFNQIVSYCEVNTSDARNTGRDCEFSDEIDKLAEYYDKVYEMLMEMNIYCSTQLLFLVLDSLAAVLTQVG